MMRKNSIHPFFLWGMEPIPAVIGREAGYTWTGHQSITGPQRHNRAHSQSSRVNLKSPVNLTACFWTVGGSRRTRREPTHTRGEHAASTQTEPAGIRTRNPLLWGYGADHHTWGKTLNTSSTANRTIVCCNGVVSAVTFCPEISL